MSNKSFEGYQILDNEGPTVPNGFKFNALNGSSIQIELNLAQWKRISNRPIVSLISYRVGTRVELKSQFQIFTAWNQDNRIFETIQPWTLNGPKVPDSDTIQSPAGKLNSVK